MIEIGKRRIGKIQVNPIDVVGVVDIVEVLEVVELSRVVDDDSSMLVFIVK